MAVTTEELVECVRKKMRSLTAELRAIFVVGQALKPAERMAKADELFVDTRLILGLDRDRTALEQAFERAVAAYDGFAARQGA